MRQAVPSTFPFQTRFARCKRCNGKFLKTRRDRFYCNEACQHPTMRSQANVKESIEARKAIELLADRPSMQELAGIFEHATGVQFFISLTHLPKKRAAIHDDRPAREEQGGVWWNMQKLPQDEEPIEIEGRLRAKLPTPQHHGETVEEWLARGGTVRVLPPGTAMAF